MKPLTVDGSGPYAFLFYGRGERRRKIFQYRITYVYVRITKENLKDYMSAFCMLKYVVVYKDKNLPFLIDP